VGKLEAMGYEVKCSLQSLVGFANFSKFAYDIPGGWKNRPLAYAVLFPFFMGAATLEIAVNYLAHAIPFLDKPYFAAATGIPDWLMVADRKVRLRRKHVEPFWEDEDPILAAVAGGIAQHLRDDAVFHGTRAFFEVTQVLSNWSREVIDNNPDTSSPFGISGKEGEFAEPLRVNFLGHLLCEILLDAALAFEDTNRVREYYHVLDKIDPATIELSVNRLSPRSTERLAFFIGEFRRAKILWDYLDDGKLMERLNQVMRRVGMPRLPESFSSIFPKARQVLVDRKAELLYGAPVAME
jgi:hypothetical protein